MTHLTPTQQKIIGLLPATPDQLAQALYGRATESEHRPELVEGRNLVYVHIALLRRRLSARCPTGTPQAGLNGTAAQGAHIVSTPLAPSQRDPNAEENPCPLDGLGAGSERRPEAPPERRPELVEGLDEGPVEGSSRRDGLETDGYTSRIIYELQAEGT